MVKMSYWMAVEALFIIFLPFTPGGRLKEVLSWASVIMLNYLPTYVPTLSFCFSCGAYFTALLCVTGEQVRV